MAKPNDYTYEVSWSAEDAAFVCRVVDFRFIATHGDTREEAIHEAKTAVRLALEALAERNQAPPNPTRR